jgi:predicted PurR-regulated permease PerM
MSNVSERPKVETICLIFLSGAAAVFLLRYAQAILLPFILALLLFHILDPIVYWICRLGIPRIWGVSAGILNSVPFFGPIIVTVALATVAFWQFGTLGMAATVAGITLFVTSLDGFLLTPFLTGRISQMNNLAVFMSLLFWGWLWGAVGMLLAVPIMMVIKSICDHVEGLQPIGHLLGESK